MNKPEAIAHLESRVGHREVTGVEPGDVDDWIETALKRVTERNAKGPHKTDFLATDVPLNLVGGVVDLPADILPGYVTRITSDPFPTDGFSHPFELKKNRTQFSYSLCREFPLAAVEGSKVYCTREGEDSLNMGILLTGIRVPALADLLTKYNDEFIDALVEVFKERPPKP